MRAPSTNRFITVIAMFTAPSRAFTNTRDDKPVYLPFMLLVAGAVVAGFAAAVQPIDPQALSDAATTAIRDLPSEHQGRVTTDNVQSAARAILVLGPVMGAIAVSVLLLMLGLVLWLAANVAKDATRFRASLSLAAWASLPMLITDIVEVANMLAGQGQPSDSVPLNVVFFGIDPAHTLGFPLPTLIDAWIAALVAVGYRQWYSASIPKAAAMGVVVLAFHVITWGSLWLA